MSSDTHEVTLTTLAYGGDALGRLADGRAVFVPFCLPGERVQIQLIEDKRHFARGRLLSVLQASSERVTGRCRHFTECGGCHYQHLRYPAQLRAKAEILRDQLVRIGRIPNPPVAPTVASDQAWNYRNQVQFQVTAAGRLGFVRAPGATAAEDILAIQECHLPNRAINALWPQISLEAYPGLERVTVRADSDEKTMVVLQSQSPDGPELAMGAETSVVHMHRDKILPPSGSDHMRMAIRGRSFGVSPTAFFQVNEGIAEKMVEHVLACMGESNDTVVDAYCGVGLFSAFLAPLCTKLIAIESSPVACEDFALNLDEFNNVELYEDAAEHVLPALDIKPQAAVVDPPRGGMDPLATEALIKMSPGTLVYVSCDPPTLARDAARLLQGGYRLENVTPYDMFPQTYHIESISLFKK